MEDRELAKQLVGKTIKLSPTVAFFFEDNQQYVLNAQPDLENVKTEFKNENVVIKDGWKLACTLRNVRAGQLRVIDENGNDVSQHFGGPSLPPDRKARAIVASGMPQFNKDDQRDVKLRKILDNIDEKEILKVIGSNDLPYELLERLYQLELAGENPSYRSRASIIDGIRDLIKKKSGITSPGKVQDKEEKVTTARR